MFFDEIRVISRCSSRYWHRGNAGKTAKQAMNKNSPEQDLKSAICQALEEMLPSTAEEIATSVGLEPASVAACLEELVHRSRIMFNPLTKRYSLPKSWPGSGLAA